MKSTAPRKASTGSSRKSRKPHISYRLHKRGGELVLAACDSDLVGGSWKEGILRLSAPERFYAEMVCDDPRLLVNLASACTQANLVGPASVQTFVDAGLVDGDAIIRVEGVPHAIFVRME